MSSLGADSPSNGRIGLMLWPTPGLGAGFERGIWAEAAGFDDLWLPDGEGMQDPLVLAAALGVATKAIRIGTGIVPVFNRPPAVLATGVVATEQRAAGRFVLGLGSSTQNMVDRWYGVPFARPLQRVRETVELLRALFEGGKSAYDGDTLRSHGFRLKERPSRPVPIYLAAMGPRMLRLTGEIADGVVLNDMTTPDRIGWALEQLDLGAKRSGRRVDDLEIVMRRAIAVTERWEEGLEFFRDHLAFYASAPVYQDTLVRLGYGPAIEAVRAGYRDRDRARIRAAVSDEMVERVFTFGPAEHCVGRVRSDYAAGIDTVVVSPQAHDAAGFAKTCEAFAPQQAEPRSGAARSSQPS
jgi:probable F420-dependent oxidoreductase